MSEKHYKIAVKKGIDKSEIMHDLGRDTTSDSSVDSSIIPDRTVDTINNRSSSSRVFEVALTDDEAQNLEKDPRIQGAEDPETLGEPVEAYATAGPGTWVRASSATTRNNSALLTHI